MLRQSFTAGALGIVLMLGGCQTVDVDQIYAQTYQKELSEASSQGVLDTTSSNARRVQAIAGRLIAQAPKLYPDAAQWQWQVSLINSKEVNANGGPGGKVIVYAGLLDQVHPADDEVAAVIAAVIARAESENGHEAVRRHHAYAQISGQGSLALLGMNQDSLAMASVMNASRSNPQQEKKADLQSLELVARAGYNPNAAITVLQKMMQREGLSSIESDALRPVLEARIVQLREAIPQVMPLYEQADKP